MSNVNLPKRPTVACLQSSQWPVERSQCELQNLKSSRQVQDLEKQLAQTRQQLQHLRSIPKAVEIPDHPRHGSRSPSPNSRETGSVKRRKIGADRQLSHVRINLRSFGKGIIIPPHGDDRDLPAARKGSFVPALPSLQEVDHLLEQYHTYFYKVLPSVPWNAFSETVKTVCAKGSLESEPGIWISLFFSILALGALPDRSYDAERYFSVAKSLFDVWTDHITSHHPQVALLMGIYLVETNQREAGWTCLGITIRMAQDIGLHTESQDLQSPDEEARRRLWWSIYACDT